MVWKLVNTVFQGGTDAARKLYGKRVRIPNDLVHYPTYELSKPGGIGRNIDLRTGREGFVGHPPEGKLDQITLAFPQSKAVFVLLDHLMRVRFYAIHVNWPTFKLNFDVDI